MKPRKTWHGVEIVEGEDPVERILKLLLRRCRVRANKAWDGKRMMPASGYRSWTIRAAHVEDTLAMYREEKQNRRFP